MSGVGLPLLLGQRFERGAVFFNKVGHLAVGCYATVLVVPLIDPKGEMPYVLPVV